MARAPDLGSDGAVGKVPALAVTVTLTACGASAAPRPAPPPVPPPPPRAELRVTSSACPDAPATEAKLMAVLVEHDAVESDLVIEVTAEPGALQLMVLRTGGEIGLDRRYPIGPADCSSAADLVALGVDRFLSSFPAWAGPAPRPEAPPPPAPPPPRRVDVAVTSAVHGLWSPIGVDAQLGVSVFRGRPGASALIRATIPQAAGAGSFQQTTLLAGAGARLRRDAWQVGAELRGGALLVSGVGFDENHSDWLPWWEIAVTGGRRFGWGTVGVEVAATALQHRAVTEDLLTVEDIPALRFGVAGSFGVFP
jgi:hypothetical protein